MQEKNCIILETINSIFGTELKYVKEKNSVYLQVMREFKDSFEK
jgi:hypothetical protein